MKDSYRLLDRLASRPLAVTGAGAARVLLGFVGFMYYASHYGDRHFLFGPDAVLPWDRFVSDVHDMHTFSLYTLSASPLWFEAVFHAGMAAALAVTVGVGGRAVLAAHWILLWSLYQRQIILLDGGDNLAYLVLPMLLLTRCYDRFSFPTGSAAKLSCRLPAALRSLPTALRSLSAPLHNLGVLAVITQLCLVYTVSGLYKVQGRMWQDGTALFYVLRVAEFTFPGVSDLVYDNDALVVAGSYATTVFLVYFPIGILIRRLRHATAAVSIAFHLSIAVLMGLTGFALTMIACDLILLSGPIDRAAHRLTALLRRAPVPAPSHRSGERTGPPTQVLAYDGDCGFCQAAVDRLAAARPAMRATPWQHLPATLVAPHLPRLDREVILFTDGEADRGGARALAAYLRTSPRARWRLAATLLDQPGPRHAARLVYRAVAHHRHRLPGATAACAIPARPTPTSTPTLAAQEEHR